MFRRLLIAFTVCLIALGGLNLRDRIDDLQWQLDQVNSQIVHGLPRLIQRVIPSVVYVEAGVDDNYYDDYGYEYIGWSGSGIIIGPHTVLTAGHVIEDANSFTITIVDGDTYEAIEWEMDPNNDCGILIFDEILGPIAELTDSDEVRIGDRVFIIGSPYGKDFFNTVTIGIISGLDREVSFFGEDLMITVDAASNPGNSGGPVFDMRGRVIGILVGGIWGADGLSILTPANICKEFYEKIDSKRN